MKKSKFTGEEIAYALRRPGLGVSVVEVFQNMDISEATFCRWKQPLRGMGPSELPKLQQLKEGSQKLKRLVTDLGLGKAMLQDALG